MAIRFSSRTAGSRAISSFLSLASVLMATALFAPAASAQDPQTVMDAIEDIAENRSGSYARNRSIGGQFLFLTGLGGFSEQRTLSDTEALSGAIEELFFLQTQNTPTVRVPDLPNPYTTSVQLLPSSQFNSRIVGSELNFEPLPRR
ncbi:MAG: hypothetical protein AAFQ40_11210 [Cyanobacteria bacterium J06623_5]